MEEKTRVNRYKELREKIEKEDPEVFNNQEDKSQSKEGTREQLDNTQLDINREYEIKEEQSDDGITKTMAYSLDEILNEYKNKGKEIKDEPKSDSTDKKINILLILSIALGSILVIAIVVMIILFATGVL